MRIIFIAVLSVFCIQVRAQISGKVTDSNGEALPYTSVYLEGTTVGTSTNQDGYFTLNLNEGNYTLIFQYIGYKSVKRKVEVSKKPITINVQLSEDNFNLNEIEIVANIEDPAYPIIRNAIEKRSYYKSLFSAYSCQVYVKGVQKVLDAPKSFFGKNIGDLDGSLDSNRQGIVYLSESLADYFFAAPDKYKEVMISSKVSGRDNGFSFNRASLMNFSFYDNTIDFGRPILSPIANNALSYYKYKLIGTTYDDAQRLIYKIQVIPKISEEPTFSGYIYIVDNLWNIQSTELMITGKSIQQPILDSLWLKQTFIPIEQPDKWCLFSQSLDFGLGILGFKIKGNFTGVYTNYNIQPNFSIDFFTNEVFKVEKEANQKDSTYWQKIRPIPLTKEEQVDYVRKDSIQVIRESKPYKDSTDRVANKLKWQNFIFGYQYQNSWKLWKIGYSPLSTIGFNAVQGFYLQPKLHFEKTFDKDVRNELNITPSVNYSFAEKKWRGILSASYLFNRIKFSEISFEIGEKVSQFNEQKPITPIINTFYSLLFKENHIRLYNQKIVKVQFKSEIVNGLVGTANFSLQERSNLVVNTNYSFKKTEKSYTHNIPTNDQFSETTGVPTHQAFISNIQLKWTPQLRYLSYPHVKIKQDSKFPDVTISWKQGWKIANSDVDYSHLKLAVDKDIWQFGLWGYSRFHIEGGYFIRKENLPFIDYQHFNGNEIELTNNSYFSENFMRLPYYNFSTNGWHYLGGIEHNFEGLLFNKIPLINKLGWQEVVGIRYLQVQNQPKYFELSIGIDNIGWGAFKLFRFDLAHSFYNGKFQGSSIIFSIKL
ncbi:MAG: DUF5686 and carboxypeptidase regulatory-like domain-containing protein [Saprospiraceae bacterium]